MLLGSFLISTVSATDDNTNNDPTQDMPVSSDNPILIAQENSTTILEDDPVLIQQPDNSTLEITDPRIYSSENDSDDNLLISTQTKPDYTGYFVGIIALVAVISVSAFAILKRYKK